MSPSHHITKGMPLSHVRRGNGGWEGNGPCLSCTAVNGRALTVTEVPSLSSTLLDCDGTDSNKVFLMVGSCVAFHSFRNSAQCCRVGSIIAQSTSSERSSLIITWQCFISFYFLQSNFHNLKLSCPFISLYALPPVECKLQEGRKAFHLL